MKCKVRRKVIQNEMQSKMQSDASRQEVKQKEKYQQQKRGMKADVFIVSRHSARAETTQHLPSQNKKKQSEVR